MLVAVVLLFTTILIMSGRVAPELVALTALMILTVAGPLTPSEAFQGFASPTIVMIVASFFLAAALKRTGLAEQLGVMVARSSKGSERAIVVRVMLLGAVVSAFMNNVSAVALLLPSVVTVAAYANMSPSLLYLPLSFAVLMGGTLSLIGTPPNLVTSDILASLGHKPFGMLTLTPWGVVGAGVGITIVAFLYRSFLPRLQDVPQIDRRDLPSFYRLRDHLCLIRVPGHSGLCGKSLEETHFGEALGAEVIGIVRDGKRRLAPPPHERIRAEDQLVVVADAEEIDTLFHLRGVIISRPDQSVSDLLVRKLGLYSLEVTPKLLNLGSSLRGIRFKERFGSTVVAIERGTRILSHYLGNHELYPGDRLLMVVPQEGMWTPDLLGAELIEQEIGEWLLSRVSVVDLPEESRLAGISISSSRLGELAGVAILALLRGSELLVLPGPQEIVAEGDTLIIAGDPERLGWLSMLSELEIAVGATQSDFESSAVGLVEAIVPPQSKLVNKTLAETDFREKYDFQVLAMWRGGRSHYQRLGSMRLALGDALLLQGPRLKIPILAKNSDFLVLGGVRPQSLAWPSIAALCFAVAVLVGGSVFQLMPPHMAMILAVLVTVAAGLVSMEDGVREVDWRIVLFVGALLPFQVALERAGVFTAFSTFVGQVAAGHSLWLVLALLLLTTSLIAQIIEGSVAALLVTPAALQLAPVLGVSATVLAATVACGASLAYLSPTSHRCHIMVMSAGGYSWRDVLRLGLPVTTALLVTAVLMSLIMAKLGF